MDDSEDDAFVAEFLKTVPIQTCSFRIKFRGLGDTQAIEIQELERKLNEVIAEHFIGVNFDGYRPHWVEITNGSIGRSSVRDIDS